MTKTRDFNTITAGHDEWLTPKYITDTLGPFQIDPCAPIVRPWDTAEKHLTVEDDGLKTPWCKGMVWCNPPYGRETFIWLEKLAAHGNGIALIFARTETIGFHATVWGKATAMLFLKGRLKFHRVNGEQGDTANAPSVLVAYGIEAAKRLKKAADSGEIAGKFLGRYSEPEARD